MSPGSPQGVASAGPPKGGPRHAMRPVSPLQVLPGTSERPLARVRTRALTREVTRAGESLSQADLLERSRGPFPSQRCPLTWVCHQLSPRAGMDGGGGLF